MSKRQDLATSTDILSLYKQDQCRRWSDRTMQAILDDATITDDGPNNIHYLLPLYLSPNTSRYNGSSSGHQESLSGLQDSGRLVQPSF